MTVPENACNVESSRTFLAMVWLLGDTIAAAYVFSPCAQNNNSTRISRMARYRTACMLTS